MQTVYDGAHSIIFCRPEVFNDDDSFKAYDQDTVHGPEDFYGGFHSWYSFGLVPSSRPFVAPPAQKVSTLEIPGANGLVDLSQVPLGLPTYSERTGSWEFHIAHDITGKEWALAYQEIMERLHGKNMAVILTDDPSYYYFGRITVNQYKSDQMNSTITLNYNLYPYKRMIWTTLGDWLWDPFDFFNGEIHQSDFKDIPCTCTQIDSQGKYILNQDGNIVKSYTSNYIGTEPVTPTIIVNPEDGIMLEFQMAVHNIFKGTVRYYTLQHGVNHDPQMMFAAPDFYDNTRIIIAGNGTVSIKLRPGRL